MSLIVRYKGLNPLHERVAVGDRSPRVKLGRQKSRGSEVWRTLEAGRKNRGWNHGSHLGLHLIRPYLMSACTLRHPPFFK